MIIQEPYGADGSNLVRTYSDRGLFIHGGFPEADYEEAIDPVDAHRVFVETDKPINGLLAEEALAIIMGEKDGVEA